MQSTLTRCAIHTSRSVAILQILLKWLSWQTARKIEKIITVILVDSAASIIIRSFAASLMPHRRCEANVTTIVSETQSAVDIIVGGQDVVQTR